MSENVNTYAEIKEALDHFDYSTARILLTDALKQSPTAELYFLGARAAINDTQRMQFLEKVIALDPFHEEAHHELERLKNVRPTTPLVVTPASQPSTSSRAENRKLLQDAIMRFSSNDWQLKMSSSDTARLEKRRGANKWAEIALVVILNGIGMIIVLLNRYARRPESVTLQVEDDGVTVMNNNMSRKITNVSDILDLAHSIITPTNIWIIVGIWVVREIIVAAALSR